jgi:hypothetical protein
VKVFLSWSGSRSKAVAQALNDWLVEVIQTLEPWLSSDIDKGSRWSPEVTASLETSSVGIICLTKENLSEPWILFEAGALSKTKDAHVCTFLLDVNHSDVKQPLAQFQHTIFSKEDILKLLVTINDKVKAGGEKELLARVLEKVFEKNWAELEGTLTKIEKEGSSTPSNKRTDRELLEEMLEILRTLNLKGIPNPYATSNLGSLLAKQGIGLIDGQLKGALDEAAQAGLRIPPRSQSKGALDEAAQAGIRIPPRPNRPEPK